MCPDPYFDDDLLSDEDRERAERREAALAPFPVALLPPDWRRLHSELVQRAATLPEWHLAGPIPPMPDPTFV